MYCTKYVACSPQRSTVDSHLLAASSLLARRPSPHSFPAVPMEGERDELDGVIGRGKKKESGDGREMRNEK